MRKPGYIYQLSDGKFAIAYKHEQDTQFLMLGRLIIHIFEDQMCIRPVIDPTTGKGKKILKSNSLLKFVGFND